MTVRPVVLTIAGSDTSAGAGIQADLKTCAALGAYGLSVTTALTSQNTRGVSEVYLPPAHVITSQLTAVFEDFAIGAVKIGMLGNAEIVASVVKALKHWHPQWIVLDTVMLSKHGISLLSPEAITILRTELLPLVDLVTPNLYELAMLLGCEVAKTFEEMQSQGQQLLARGARQVLVKGGHLENEAHCRDCLVSQAGSVWFSSPRIKLGNPHGTGCTLSSAIAALRTQRPDWHSAIADAKDYLTNILTASIDFKINVYNREGISILDHFCFLLKKVNIKD